ncbi:unnamed protein product [Clonostachys solani]|uniref:Copper transport protein n=1 Tax=Clonostachys solani TaxID=160281 RepID=A0A9P0EDZ3_9HYPO|nr:unnamed protein product [Clonostachys solani]
MDHHAHMNHGDMDHGDMDHGDGGMKDMCNMNMLFTWDTNYLCIVFRQWHVRSTSSLIFSLLAVVLIGIGYEAIRAFSRRYELASSKRVDSLPSVLDSVTESTPFLPAGQSQAQLGQRTHVVKGALLLFMTYNGWVMIAVTLGAFFGYLIFGKSSSATKENACH